MKEIIIALIMAAPASVMAFLAWRATKGTHRLVNSRMDELLKKARKEATNDERERASRED